MFSRNQTSLSCNSAPACAYKAAGHLRGLLDFNLTTWRRFLLIPNHIAEILLLKNLGRYVIIDIGSICHVFA